MSSTKKKMMHEGKQFLLEKIHRIEVRQQWLARAIMDISEPAIIGAKKLLEETDKKKFCKRYQQINSALETSFSTLVLLTASFPSAENDSDSSDSSSSTDSHPDLGSHSHNDDASVFSCVSSTTVSSHGSVNKSHASLSSDGSPRRDCQGGVKGIQSEVNHLQHDQESLRHVDGASSKAEMDTGPTRSRQCGDRDSTEGRGSVSPLHEYESGTSSSEVVDVISSDERFESAVELEQIRAPPGFHPLESMSVSTNTVHEKQVLVRQAPQNNNSPMLEQSPVEPRAKPDGSDKKAAVQCAPTGDKQLHSPGTTPERASPLQVLPSIPQEAPSLTVPSAHPPGNQQPAQLPHQFAPVQSCPVSYCIAKDVSTAVIMPLEIKVRGHVEVIVSEVKSPAIFWIQLAESPLVSFMQQLNQYYSTDLMSIPIPPPSVGTFCCACFSQDNCWYRARIIGVQAQTSGQPPDLNDPAGITVDVIYVDYGNREKLNLTRVRIIHPDFTKLPAQSVCCSLAKDGKTVLVLIVDGGSDYNVNHETKELFYGRVFKELNLDALIITSYCPGFSRRNPIEHVWAPLTRALTSVYLPDKLPGESKPPCHQSKLSTSERKKKEYQVFDNAMKHLAGYWRDTKFDGQPIKVEHIASGTQQAPFNDYEEVRSVINGSLATLSNNPVLKAELVFTHAHMDRRFGMLQFAKCFSETCTHCQSSPIKDVSARGCVRSFPSPLPSPNYEGHFVTFQESLQMPRCPVDEFMPKFIACGLGRCPQCPMPYVFTSKTNKMNHMKKYHPR